MRTWAAVMSLSLSLAPYQCGHAAARDEHEDTPAEALYTVAGRLRARGDEVGWRTTLQYLIAEYPGSRFAGAARLDLVAPDAAPPR